MSNDSDLICPDRQRQGPGADQESLTYNHMTYMVFHMKTTLNIDDTVMNRLRREAARQGRTMSELVEAALRLLFHTSREIKKKKLPPLPTFNGGKELVDIADREALYNAMGGRR